MDIRVESYGSEFLAFLANDPAVRAVGASVDAAIGALVRLHPIEFGIVVRTEERDHSQQTLSSFM